MKNTYMVFLAMCSAVWAHCAQANIGVNDSFANTGAGSFPNTLLPLKSGLWGTTTLGGPGTLFQIPSIGVVNVVYTFGEKGVEPVGGLTQTPLDGLLHGVLTRGSTFPDSAVFRTTVDNGLIVTYQSDGGPLGGGYAGDMPLGSDGLLHTVGAWGGDHGDGVVISITTNLLATVSVQHSFNDPTDGSRPQCAPVEKDGEWYGVASYGGPFGVGTFYKIDTGGLFHMEYAFPVGHGYPTSIMLASDGKFYVGVTNGGSNGAIYQIVPDSNGNQALATIIHSFSDDGGVPYSRLLEVNGHLYGLESNGVPGVSATGGLFRLDFAGGNYSYIHTFVGENPSGSLSMGLDGKLYAPLQNGDIAQIDLTPPYLPDISTRGMVQTGDNVLIGGFIVTGTQPKKVMIRAIGPSLSNHGVSGALADPTLELHGSNGVLIASDDNWQDSQAADIEASGLAPTDSLESAIIATLDPGAYTSVLQGANGKVGVALVEAYDIDNAVDSKLANISTRGLVQTGDNVLIGGIIVAGTKSATVVMRAIGPSLSTQGVSGALADPTLELHDSDGSLVKSNDNWMEQDPDQVSAIQDAGLEPLDPSEPAVIATLIPGNYTAIVRGANNTTGVALVEAYQL